MRIYRGRAFLSHEPPLRHRISPIVPKDTQSISLAALTGRALRLVWGYGWLFAVVASAAGIGEWIVYRQTHSVGILLATGIVIGALVDAIVFAVVKGKSDGWGATQIFDRFLERLWAVVLIAFIWNYVTLFGLSLLAEGDLADRIVAIPVLLIAASLVFAEAIAVTVDGEAWWFVIVRAIGSSIRISWSGRTLGRALLLLALQLIPQPIGAAIVAAATHGHVTSPSFWSDVPLGIFFSIPLDALIVLAYFDASGYEPNRTCGE